MFDGDELISEWNIFRDVLLVEKKSLMEHKEVPSPITQDLLEE